jgi:hypothetical protein
MERYGTHLPGCSACRRLLDEFRAIEDAARTAAPEVTDADWDRAWAGVARTVASDRRRAEGQPLTPLLRAARRASRRPLARAARPLLYLAASLALVAVLLTVQRAVQEKPTPASRVARATAEAGDLECSAPDYVPVAYTIGDGDDAVSVMYCAYVGADT